MEKIFTPNAPKAIGPYSQAVRAGDLLFVSGQIPIDPATGEVVTGGIEAQTKQVFCNLQAILSEAGCGFENVAKATVFLKDMNDFATVNAIYAEFFKAEPLPARAAIQIARLPKDVMVEIEVIAYTGQ